MKTDLEDLPFHLARAALAFRRFNDQTLQAVGLASQAPGLASVLHAVKELGECAVNRLVECTHLPNGTLTGLLDTLEDDGCVERIRNLDDGRSWKIRLTEKGRRLCKSLRKRHRLVMSLFRDVLSEAETAELKQLLTRITARMREFCAEAPPARTKGPKSQSSPHTKSRKHPPKKRTS